MLRRHDAGLDPHDVAAVVRAVADRRRPRGGPRRSSKQVRVEPPVLALRGEPRPGHARVAVAVPGRVAPGRAMLLHAAKAWAWLSGRDFVTPDEVKAIAKPACATASSCARRSSSRAPPPTPCSTACWPRCRSPVTVDAADDARTHAPDRSRRPCWPSCVLAASPGRAARRAGRRATSPLLVVRAGRRVARRVDPQRLEVARTLPRGPRARATGELTWTVRKPSTARRARRPGRRAGAVAAARHPRRVHRAAGAAGAARGVTRPTRPPRSLDDP